MTGIRIKQQRVIQGPLSELLPCRWDSTGGPHCEVAVGDHRQGRRGAWSIIPLFSSAPHQEGGQVCGQCTIISQIFIHVKLDLFLLPSFGGHSSIGSCGGRCPWVCAGPSTLHDLLWDSCGSGCRWRSPREWLNHSSAGCDCGG